MYKKLLLCLILVLGMAGVANAAPEAAQLTPAYAGTVATPVKLTWTAGDGATAHHVYCGTDYTVVSTATTGYAEVTMPDTNYPVPSPTLETLYYWRVDANASGVVSPGAVRMFWTWDGTAGDPAMALWLKLDNECGTDLPTVCRDWSGNDCTGIAFDTAGPTYVAGAPSAIGQSPTNLGMDLNVAAGSVVGLYPHQPAMDQVTANQELTVAFWINADVGSTVTIPFHAQGTAGFMLGVYFYTATNLWWIADPVWHPMDATVAAADYQGTWAHMAFTKNVSAGTMAMYLNGNLVTSVGSRPYSFNQPFAYYGIGGWGLAPGTGALMDDWRMYSIELSDAEIKRIAGVGDPNKAYRPSPKDGATGISETGTTLSWMPGDGAVTHDVYLGTTAGSLSPLATGLVNPTTPSGALGLDQTYYWRVDEVNGTTTTGDEWSFTTVPGILIEDFESYPNDVALQAVWPAVYGGFDYSFLETAIIHGGAQSMCFRTENFYSPYKMEVARTFGPTLNWTTSGIKSLGLWFTGDPTNLVQDINLKITDGDATPHTGTLKYPDSNAHKSLDWIYWPVKLSDPCFSAVTMSNVAKLAIEVDNGGVPTPSGDLDYLYVDDIWVYPTRCVPEFGPVGDCDGDCEVGNTDIKVMSEEWLKCSTPHVAGCKPMNPYRIITPKPAGLVVDGNLAEWDAAGVTWHEFEQPWAIYLPDDCNDVTAFKYALTWDANHIYVAAKVTDRIQLTQDPPYPPIGDILEVRLEANGTFTLDSFVPEMDFAQNYNLYQYPAGTPVATWSDRGPTGVEYPGGAPIAADAGLQYAVALDATDANVICYEARLGTFSNYAGKGGTPPTTYRTMVPGIVVGFDIQVDSLKVENDPCHPHAGDLWGAILSSWTRTTTTCNGFMPFQIVASQATACGDWGRPTADLDNDCDVDLNDYNVLANNWLKEQLWP